MQTFKQFFLEKGEGEIVGKIFDDGYYNYERRISNINSMSGNIDERCKIKVDNSGYIHNDSGPAYRREFLDGKIFEEIWAKHGKKHRLDGPAQTRWDYMSNKYLEQYFINGQSYSKEEFDEYVKGLNNKEDKELLGDLGQTFD